MWDLIGISTPPYKGPVTRNMFPFDDVTMYPNGFILSCCFSLWLFLSWLLRYQWSNPKECGQNLPLPNNNKTQQHYNGVIMGAITSLITSLTIVYSIVYSDADQRKHQSSASLAFVRRSHRGPVNSPHKWPVTRKMFPFDDVIMNTNRVRNLFTTVDCT